MKNWKEIEYLLEGNETQKKAYKAIRELNIFEILKDYDPILVGTVPIEIDILGSDLDIICEVHDIESFKSVVSENFGMCKNYIFKDKLENNEHIAVVNFHFMEFEFEIYAKSTPTITFNGYMHMLIEDRILGLLGDGFRDEIVKLKKSGLKTEPSFAELLGLEGNSYEELLKLIDCTDQEIINLFKNAKPFSNKTFSYIHSDFVNCGNAIGNSNN